MIPETARRPDWPRLVKNDLARLESGKMRKGEALVVGARSIAASTSISKADYFVKVNATTGAVTVTLPLAADNVGRVLVVKKIDASANAVTLDGTGVEMIDGAATQTTTTQYVSFTVTCDGTGWWII